MIHIKLLYITIGKYYFQNHKIQIWHSEIKINKHMHCT